MNSHETTEETITAKLFRHSQDGDRLSEKNVNVRYCYGEEPHQIEIILYDDTSYYDDIIIGVGKLERLIHANKNKKIKG